MPLISNRYWYRIDRRGKASIPLVPVCSQAPASTTSHARGATGRPAMQYRFACMVIDFGILHGSGLDAEMVAGETLDEHDMRRKPDILGVILLSSSSHNREEDCRAVPRVQGIHEARLRASSTASTTTTIACRAAAAST
jgi:hypothetical protein